MADEKVNVSPEEKKAPEIPAPSGPGDPPAPEHTEGPAVPGGDQAAPARAEPAPGEHTQQTVLPGIGEDAPAPSGKVINLSDIQAADMAMMGCGHNKAVRLFADLEQIGLIERRKQGQGRPTRIYVKNFILSTETGEPEEEPDTPQPPAIGQTSEYGKSEAAPEVLTSPNRKSVLPETGSPDFPKANAMTARGLSPTSAFMWVTIKCCTVATPSSTPTLQAPTGRSTFTLSEGYPECSRRESIHEQD